MYILYDTYVEQLPMYVKYESHMTHIFLLSSIGWALGNATIDLPCM